MTLPELSALFESSDLGLALLEFDHPVGEVKLVETHISWVLLTGDFAYKIKKPVNFGFLDFSTLQQRLEYCKAELRLNSRLAPDIYLAVVPISESGGGLCFNCADDPVEYAVKMRQFPQSAQLDNMLAAGLLQPAHMDAFAVMAADFHRTADVAGENSAFGSPQNVYRPVAENFAQIREHLETTAYADTLDRLEAWCKDVFEGLQPAMVQRKRDGFIRECHGDMHLRNLLWLDNKPMAFDCIEFSAGLRWIDTISDVAFLVMDLQDRRQEELANRFLNAYLEHSGDYQGLPLLKFYLCYRALVRAKVDVLRMEQEQHSAAQIGTIGEFESYLQLAVRYTRPASPVLLIMRGMSASGKSTLSQQLVDRTGAIRIRSDIERKRLFDIAMDENASTGIEQGIYSASASRRTYERLATLAAGIIRAGHSVIVDATFPGQEQRNRFSRLAEELAVPFRILELTAPAEVLRQRIRARTRGVSDADIAVLEHQLANWQPLQEAELASALTVDTTRPEELEKISRIRLD